VNPLTGETITVFNRVDPFEDVILLVTNPEGLFRTYDGLEVIANGRFFDNLSLSGSFVYSRVKGNISNTFNGSLVFQPDPNNFNQFFNFNPNQLINFEGTLTNDPSVAWKISGVYELPWGFNTAWFFRHQSGDTWTPLVRVTGYIPKRFRIFGLPRGSNRLPSQNILDLRIEKLFALYGGQLRFTADIFNLFNSAYATAVDDRVESDSLGEPITLTAPRTIRLGIRYTF
jgi:hypothetical protein